MAVKNTKQIYTGTLNTTDDYFTENFDASSYNGFFISIIGPALGTGTAYVQVSNDNVNYYDLANFTITTGKAYYNVTSLYAPMIRIKIDLSAGAGSYTTTIYAKDKG